MTSLSPRILWATFLLSMPLQQNVHCECSAGANTLHHAFLTTQQNSVFDQALFAKVSEIVWQHDKFKNIIIRMIVFHTIWNLLTIMGKRFQDAGLRDLCVESWVITERSVTGLMEGRKYNRAVRVHKLLDEALMWLAWKGFIHWLQDNHTEDIHHLVETLKNIGDFHSSVCQESIQLLVEDESCTRTLKLFHMYLDSLRNAQSLSAFWISYLGRNHAWSHSGY